MTEIVHPLQEDTDHAGVEALARLLAAHSGLVRAEDEGDPFSDLQPAARHAMRELALTYMRVIGRAAEAYEDTFALRGVGHVIDWLVAEDL